MAMYYCEGCDRYIDDDWHPMEISELCPDCHENVRETPQMRQHGVFSQDQLAQIRKMEQEAPEED